MELRQNKTRRNSSRKELKENKKAHLLVVAVGRGQRPNALPQLGDLIVLSEN
jgi:hypothetical protein